MKLAGAGPGACPEIAGVWEVLGLGYCRQGHFRRAAGAARRVHSGGSPIPRLPYYVRAWALAARGSENAPVTALAEARQARSRLATSGPGDRCGYRLPIGDAMRVRHIAAALTATVAVAAPLAGCVPAPAPAKSAAKPAPKPTPKPTTAAPTTCQLFPSTNVWHADISKLPVNAHSAAWLASSAAPAARCCTRTSVGRTASPSRPSPAPTPRSR